VRELGQDAVLGHERDPAGADKSSVQVTPRVGIRGGFR
jgi:hypothetical protein